MMLASNLQFDRVPLILAAAGKAKDSGSGSGSGGAEGDDKQLCKLIGELKFDECLLVFVEQCSLPAWTHVCAAIVKTLHLPLFRVRSLILEASFKTKSSSPSQIAGQLIGAMTTEGNSPFHAFLWQARFCMRDYVEEDLWRLPGEEELDCCRFCLSALQGLLSSSNIIGKEKKARKGSSKPGREEWFLATCCQIAYEIVYFYWVGDCFELALQPLSDLKGLLASNPNLLTKDKKSEWMEFSLDQLDKIEAVLLNAKRRESKEENYLLSAIKNRNFGDLEICQHLLEDVVDQSVNIGWKRMILSECLRENQPHCPQVALLNAICVSIPLMLSDESERKIDENRIAKIKVEFLGAVPGVDLMLEALIRVETFIPIDIVGDWKCTWEIIVFTSMMEINYKSYHEHPFMANFFQIHPKLLYHEEKGNAGKEGRAPLNESNGLLSGGDRIAAYPEVARQAILLEILITSLRKEEEQYIPELKQLATQFGGHTTKFFIKLAKDQCEMVKGNAITALNILEIAKLSNTPFNQAFHLEIEGIQRQAVITGLLGHIKSLGDKNAIRDSLNAFNTTPDITTPPNLEIFAQVLTLMIRNDEFEVGLQYTGTASSKLAEIMGEEVKLSKSVAIVGKCMLSIYQVEKLLEQYEVVNSTGGQFNIEKMDALSDELILQLVKFSSQITQTIGTDGQPDVTKEVLTYILGCKAFVGEFIVGAVGGSLKRSEGKSLSLAGLGPASVFSCPLSIPNAFGFESLPSKVKLEEEAISRQNILQFLEDYCLQSKQIVKPYLLLGDIYMVLEKPELARKHYLNYVLCKSNYLKDIKEIYNFFDSHLITLITVCLTLKDYVSACFFGQFQRPPSYNDLLFPHMKLALASLTGTLHGPICDPPITRDASPIYGFFDIQLIEYLVSNLSSSSPLLAEDDNSTAVKMLLTRLGYPMYHGEGAKQYEIFRSHILLWYLRKLIKSSTQS